MSNHAIVGYANSVTNVQAQNDVGFKQREPLYYFSANKDSHRSSVRVKLYDVAVSRKRQEMLDRNKGLRDAHTDIDRRRQAHDAEAAYKKMMQAIIRKDGYVLIPSGGGVVDKTTYEVQKRKGGDHINEDGPAKKNKKSVKKKNAGKKKKKNAGKKKKKIAVKQPAKAAQQNLGKQAAKASKKNVWNQPTKHFADEEDEARADSPPRQAHNLDYTPTDSSEGDEFGPSNPVLGESDEYPYGQDSSDEDDEVRNMRAIVDKEVDPEYPQTYVDFLAELEVDVSDTDDDLVGAVSALPKMPYLSDSLHIRDRYNKLNAITTWMQTFNGMRTTHECYVHMSAKSSAFQFKWITSLNSRYYVPGNFYIDPESHTITCDGHTYSLNDKTTCTSTESEATQVVPGVYPSNSSKHLVIETNLDKFTNVVHEWKYEPTYTDGSNGDHLHPYRYFRQTDKFTDVMMYSLEMEDENHIFRVSERLHTYVPFNRSDPGSERVNWHSYRYNPRLLREQQTESMADVHDIRKLTIDVNLHYVETRDEYSDCTLQLKSTDSVTSLRGYLIAFKWDSKNMTYVARRCYPKQRYNTPNVVHACGLPAAITSYKSGRLPVKLNQYIDVSSNEMTNMNMHSTPNNAVAPKIDMFNFVPYSEQRYEASFDTVETCPVINIDTAYTASQGDAHANAALLCIAFSERERAKQVKPTRATTAIWTDHGLDIAKNKPIDTIDYKRLNQLLSGAAVRRTADKEAKDLKHQRELDAKATERLLIISHAQERIKMTTRAKKIQVTNVKVETNCFWYSSDEWRVGFIPIECDGDKDPLIIDVLDKPFYSNADTDAHEDIMNRLTMATSQMTKWFALLKSDINVDHARAAAAWSTRIEQENRDNPHSPTDITALFEKLNARRQALHHAKTQLTKYYEASKPNEEEEKTEKLLRNERYKTEDEFATNWKYEEPKIVISKENKKQKTKTKTDVVTDENSKYHDEDKLHQISVRALHIIEHIYILLNDTPDDFTRNWRGRTGLPNDTGDPVIIYTVCGNEDYMFDLSTVPA